MVRSYFARCAGASEFFTYLALFRYLLKIWLPRVVPCLFPAMKRSTASRSVGLSLERPGDRPARPDGGRRVQTDLGEHLRPEPRLVVV